MNHNLCCDELSDVIQTPSWITELILSYDAEGKGLPDGGWEGVAHRYVSWLRYLKQNEFNAACEDRVSQERIRSIYNCRIELVRRAVHLAKLTGKGMHFYSS